jgi:hypothetical protein
LTNEGKRDIYNCNYTAGRRCWRNSRVYSLQQDVPIGTSDPSEAN